METYKCFSHLCHILGSASHRTVGSMKVGTLAHEIMRAVFAGGASPLHQEEAKIM